MELVNNKDIYLYLEPYVEISEGKESILLYNTLDGEKILVRDVESKEVIKKLSEDNSCYCIDLSADKLKDINVQNFIRILRKKFMGDYVYKDKVNSKPLQFNPIVNVQEDMKLRKFHDLKKNDSRIGDLLKLNLYLNNDSSKFNYSSQLNSPFHNFKGEVGLEGIEKVLSNLSKNQHVEIEIFIGQSPLSANYIEILDKLKGRNLSFHVSIQDEKLLKSLSAYGEISMYYDESNQHIFQSSYINTHVFVIKSEESLEKVEALSTEYSDMNIDLIPYLELNTDFFEKYVYLTQEDINDISINEKDYHINKFINSNFFGILSIIPNGEIYSNFNEKCLGNIFKDSLLDVVHSEIINGESWRLTRDKVSVCKDCEYRYLCPPISNYELVQDKYNLCLN